MKKILILALSVVLVLVAGCTTTSPGTTAATTTTTTVPVTVSPTSTVSQSYPANALPMNASVTLGNATHQITASIDSFELAAGSEPGNYTVTIYVAARNTGKDPVKYVWFSKLTDLNGNSYGGIGVSHGGNGARTEWILPNGTEAARDYVDVDSNQGLTALTHGAVLDVYFIEQQVNATYSLVPDYHVTWAIDPGTIQ